MRIVALLLLALASAVSAQFGFFDQMFSGGGQQQHHQQAQNVPSDSSAYRTQYGRSHCDKYLCPDTLGWFPPFPFGVVSATTADLSASMCALPTSLPLRMAVTRGQV